MQIDTDLAGNVDGEQLEPGAAAGAVSAEQPAAHQNSVAAARARGANARQQQAAAERECGGWVGRVGAAARQAAARQRLLRQGKCLNQPPSA